MTADAILTRLSRTDASPGHVVNGLTGVMFDSGAGSMHEFHGYIRVSGQEYLFHAVREDDRRGARRRWVLKLTPTAGAQVPQERRA